jgi:hypothetical protein
VNPFKEWYWKQFGGGPTPEDLKVMDPMIREMGAAKKKKAG